MKRMLLSFAIIAVIATPAMAIDFTRSLTNMDGSPVVSPDGKPLEKPPTLGTICEQALLSQFPDERDQSGKETITPQQKFERWKLALKLKGKDVTLTAEEVTLIKQAVGKAYSPLIVGQAWSLLDPSVH